MAVVVTDTRTVINEADATTGWNTGAVRTETFAEATACIGRALNIATGQLYFTGSAQNVSNTLIYVYGFNNAVQGVWTGANPPLALHIGDGTNRVSFKMAGGDRRVFSHSDGPTEWQSLVLDGSQASAMNSAGLTTARAGSFGALNLNAITQFGTDQTTLSKALAGGFNAGCDIIRIGNGGIVITGGTTGDRGTFLEIVIEDRSTANLKAHGLIREYSTNLYGCQGPLTFGAATGTSWFDDAGVTLAFENRNIGDDKYFINIIGGSGETHFFLTDSAIVTAGPLVECDFSSNNINTLNITGCSFTNLGNPITFADDSASESHIIERNTFTNTGQIYPGETQFTNNSINNNAGSAEGALLLSTGDGSNLSNLSFVSGGTGHAILITAPGTYDFTNFTYSGYGGNETTDAVVYNNSGGVVEINIFGGDGPTVRNGAGATTIINNPRTLTLTNIQSGSEVRLYDAFDTTTEFAGEETVFGSLQSFTILNGGSGYTVGNTLTLSGGMFSTAAQIEVTETDGGGSITNAIIATPGSYEESPAIPTPLTGGSGSGATINPVIRANFVYNYNYGSDTPLIIVVFSLGFKPLRLSGISLVNSNQSIPVFQIIDRVYFNPP
jgi:hypothetical protein